MKIPFSKPTLGVEEEQAVLRVGLTQVKTTDILYTKGVICQRLKLFVRSAVRSLKTIRQIIVSIVRESVLVILCFVKVKKLTTKVFSVSLNKQKKLNEKLVRQVKDCGNERVIGNVSLPRLAKHLWDTLYQRKLKKELERMQFQGLVKLIINGRVTKQVIRLFTTGLEIDLVIPKYAQSVVRLNRFNGLISAINIGGM